MLFLLSFNKKKRRNNNKRKEFLENGLIAEIGMKVNRDNDTIQFI